jgi:hypothetical protein
VVGHFLRRLYTDILAEDYPYRLQILIAQLGAIEHERKSGSLLSSGEELERTQSLD